MQGLFVLLPPIFIPPVSFPGSQYLLAFHLPPGNIGFISFTFKLNRKGVDIGELLSFSLVSFLLPPPSSPPRLPVFFFLLSGFHFLKRKKS